MGCRWFFLDINDDESLSMCSYSVEFFSHLKHQVLCVLFKSTRKLCHCAEDFGNKMLHPGRCSPKVNFS
jgi:hypothetical protein